MKVLVACEFSGVVRDAFIRRGHDAWSCDLMPSESNHGPHIIDDVLNILSDGWEMIIAFPPCTHLASSGARYFKEKREDGRQKNAKNFFMKIANAPVGKIAIENPVGVISTYWRKPDQIIQPWMFGHKESKKTCLWLKNLPLLKPTNIVNHPHYVCSCGTKFKYELGKYGCPNCAGYGYAARMIYENQTPTGQNKLGPSPDRAAKRSKTYHGIAEAMADQWGQ